MALPRAKKVELVADLARRVKEASATVIFSFRTLPVAESSSLRRELKKSGGRLQVVKKRLFRRVAELAGLPAAAFGDLEGSVAVAWSADAIAPAKVTHTFVRERSDAAFVGGILHGTFLTREEVERLALLPSQPELQGQLVRVLAGPLRGFAGVLAATLRGFPGVLRAIAEKQG